MRFIIRTWGGYGDALLLTPALRAIKQQHADAHVTVHCVNRGHFEVLQHNPHVDALIQASPASHLGWMLMRQTRGFYAMRVAHGHEFKRPATWLERRIGALLAERPDVKRVQPAYGMCTPGYAGRPVTVVCGDLLGVTVTDRRLEYWMTSEEDREAAEAMRPHRHPVMMHVASQTSGNKNWPVDKWRALVRRNPDLTFLQIGHDREPVIDGAVNLLGYPLRPTFALLKHAKGLVAVDSVMAHAASALGIPAVVLFGPTSPEAWANPDAVALTRRLRCAPCIDGLMSMPCPYGAPCMSGIEVEEVEAALYARLAPAPATLTTPTAS